MSSKQIKIDSDLHQEVKEFVEQSSRYSSYKGFYEDAARRRLDEERADYNNLKKEIDKLKEKLD